MHACRNRQHRAPGSSRRGLHFACSFAFEGSPTQPPDQDLLQLAVQNVDFAAAVAAELAKGGQCDKGAVLQLADSFQKNTKARVQCLLLLQTQEL